MNAPIDFMLAPYRLLFIKGIISEQEYEIIKRMFQPYKSLASTGIELNEYFDMIEKLK